MLNLWVHQAHKKRAHVLEADLEPVPDGDPGQVQGQDRYDDRGAVWAVEAQEVPEVPGVVAAEVEAEEAVDKAEERHRAEMPGTTRRRRQPRDHRPAHKRPGDSRIR